MKTAKVERLQAAGWEVGSATNFLALSDEEAQLVALGLSLIASSAKTRDIKTAFTVGN